MDEVFLKTRELGEALTRSEAYINLKKAEEKAMANAEAAQAMSEYLEARTKLQEIMVTENPDPMTLKRLSDEMDEKQERMQLIDDIIALNQARDDFSAIINQVNQVLEFIVTGRIHEGGCSGNCSSCGGSCHNN